MPHYKDGTPAEIGDHVKGVPYNNGGKEIVGTLVQITEGTDACNCIVAFVKPVAAPITPEAYYDLNKLGVSMPNVLMRRKGGRIPENSNGESEPLFLQPKYDHGAIKDFVKV